MASWLKLSRKLATSAIAAKPDYLAVWIHLLMSAAYKEGEIIVGRQVVRLYPGQLVFGRKKFSEKTGVSEANIRSALEVLKTLQQITIKSESKFSIISITNWRHYQVCEPAENLGKTSSEPAVNHNKEDLEDLEKEHSDLAGANSPDGAKGKRADPIPYAQIFDAYSRILPTLPQPKLKDDARKAAIRSRWRADKKFQDVDFWERYFTYISENRFLMSMRGAAFDWFMAPKNFKKVIEGNYDDA